MNRAANVALFFLFLFAVSMGGCGGCGGCKGGPPGKQPALIATYCFDNSNGTGQYTLTVNFQGTTTAASGPGKTSFSEFEMQQFTAGTRMECVAHRVYDLRSGGWNVKATPNGVGAPFSCPVNVPGSVTLDVSGSQPTCR